MRPAIEGLIVYMPHPPISRKARRRHYIALHDELERREREIRKDAESHMRYIINIEGRGLEIAERCEMEDRTPFQGAACDV